MKSRTYQLIGLLVLVLTLTAWTAQLIIHPDPVAGWFGPVLIGVLTLILIGLIFYIRSEEIDETERKLTNKRDNEARIQEQKHDADLGQLRYEIRTLKTQRDDLITALTRLAATAHGCRPPTNEDMRNLRVALLRLIIGEVKKGAFYDCLERNITSDQIRDVVETMHATREIDIVDGPKWMARLMQFALDKTPADAAPSPNAPDAAPKDAA